MIVVNDSSRSRVQTLLNRGAVTGGPPFGPAGGTARFRSASAIIVAAGIDKTIERLRFSETQA